jgi:SAM-dependent methyltransferase
MTAFSSSIKERFTARHKYSLTFCGDLNGKNILDIGSSFGWFEKYALKLKCKSIIGIEPEKSLFFEAQKEVPQAIFKQGSALKIPAEDKSFDLTVMFDVIEHIPKGTEMIAFKEIKRVLKPRGKLVLSTPLNFWLSNLMDPAWYFGHRHYKETELIKMLMKNGFKIESIEKRGRIYELISAILMYIFKWIFRREVPFKKWLEKKRDMEYLTKKQGFETLYIKAFI